jgi:hypothetical protein
MCARFVERLVDKLGSSSAANVQRFSWQNRVFVKEFVKAVLQQLNMHDILGVSAWCPCPCTTVSFAWSKPRYWLEWSM